MNLVADASLAIKWIVAEEREAEAEALLSGNIQWIAPAFLFVEVGNVLCTKLRRKLLVISQARDGLAFLKQTVELCVADGELTGTAFEIAVEIDHSIYDCLYLACARQEKTQMITADRRLIGKVAGTRYEADVRALAA